MPRQKTVSSGVVSRTRRPKQPDGKAGVATQADDAVGEGVVAAIDPEMFDGDPAAEMVPATDEPITAVARAGLREEPVAEEDDDEDEEDEDEGEAPVVEEGKEP